MSNPDQITVNGKLLSDILSDHGKWLKGESDGVRADLRSANLSYANLSYADLRSANLRSADLSYADLWGTTGNMKEVKSLQIDTWPVAYTAEVMQIGCQRHSIDLWRKSDPHWIADMDSKASEWWAKFGPTILSLIEVSPATPTGQEKV